jgi:DNA-binding response OmpR family regulator
MTKPLVIQLEDDLNDVFLFDRAFKKAQVTAELVSFQDGEQFMTSLSQREKPGADTPLPTLVLLDIKLPRKSGFEVLQWMRAHSVFKRIPVVMLTSSAQPMDVRRAYDLGANGYLVKPMDIDQMIRLLGTVQQFWLDSNVTAIVPEERAAAVAR